MDNSCFPSGRQQAALPYLTHTRQKSKATWNCFPGFVLSIYFAMVTEDGSQSKLMEAPSLPSLVLPRVTNWWKVLLADTHDTRAYTRVQTMDSVPPCGRQY